MGNTIQELIKQSKFESPQQMAYINLYYTYYYFHDLHCSILKPFDLLPQHYNILKIVKGRHPEAVTPGHILEVMLDKKRDLTRLVDKLVTMGHLRRCQSADNKRFIHISLTQSGYDLTVQLELELKNFIQHNLNDEESLQLSVLLDKMR
jgi:MarR family 2-MHQ and catechol resistance regulon transcriptional repressor